MRLSDLQSKNIVNLTDGKNIGLIIDVILDEKTGFIKSLVVETKGKLFSFAKLENFEINWNSIERIGEDVILVRL